MVLAVFLGLFQRALTALRTGRDIGEAMNFGSPGMPDIELPDHSFCL